MRRFIPEGFAVGTREFSLVMRKMCWEQRTNSDQPVPQGCKIITGKMARLMANIWIFELHK